MTVFGKTNQLVRKTNFFFTSSKDAAFPNLKPIQLSKTRFFFFISNSVFVLEPNFRVYAIIDFLADRLVFLNMVTYDMYVIDLIERTVICFLHFACSFLFHMKKFMLKYIHLIGY